MTNVKTKKLRNKNHSDELFITGFGIYLSIERLRTSNSFEEYINTFNNEREKQLMFQIIKVVLVTHNLEHKLISKMESLYNSSVETIKKKAQKDIVEHTMRINQIDKNSAQNLIKKQQGEFKDVWMVTPILQYVAGYTLGGLISLYKLLNGNKKLVELLKEFKEKRNNILHNTTSSRIKIKEKTIKALVLLEKIYNLLGQ